MVKAKKAEEKTPYHDQESEWESDGKYVDEKSDARQVVRDFTGGDAKNNAGQTDLSDDMAVLLTLMRVLAKEYPGLGIEQFPDWLEVYRMSVGRAGRKETVEILRGNVSIAPPPGDLGMKRGF